jgi:hypothetical protein
MSIERLRQVRRSSKQGGRLKLDPVFVLERGLSQAAAPANAIVGWKFFERFSAHGAAAS